jgi:hypothetical protein
LRLAAIGLLLLSLFSGLSGSILALAWVYGVLNAVFLSVLLRTPHSANAAPAT